MKVYIGTAGWNVAKPHVALFPTAPQGEQPSHLERYSTGLNCVEINSSFHRPHRLSTWQRWAASTPPHFRFAVKAPKAITHIAKLVDTGAALLDFFNAVNGLGGKLGPVLVQLPPKLAFDEGVAHEFLTTLRELHPGSVVLEPRHATWFTGSADRLLREFEIARVAADPPAGSPLAAQPAGWSGLRYYRFHGAPRTYYSDYSNDQLNAIAATVRAQRAADPAETWIIFDNTALGHATANAMRLHGLLTR